MHVHTPVYFLHLTILLYFALQSILCSKLGHSSATMGANPLEHLWTGLQVNIHCSGRVMVMELHWGQKVCTLVVLYGTQLNDVLILMNHLDAVKL